MNAHEPAQRLLEALWRLPGMGDLDRPHVIVTFDPITGHFAANGPYPDGIIALANANTIQSDLDRLGDGQLPPRAVPVALEAPTIRVWQTTHRTAP
jgi:hypothetical protein